MDKAREVAEEILELIKQPHIDAGTPLEDIHLVESIADIIDAALDDERREGIREGELNPPLSGRCCP
jgi:hypothetical protein